MLLQPQLINPRVQVDTIVSWSTWSRASQHRGIFFFFFFLIKPIPSVFALLKLLSEAHQSSQGDKVGLKWFPNHHIASVHVQRDV